MGRQGHCREHILQSGFELLYQKGYNATGVKEITDAAGVPKGSFYNHFASKEAFVIEAVETISTEMEQQMFEQIADNEPSAKQQLFALFGKSLDYMQANEYCGGCVVGNLTLEMADENEAIRTALEKLANRKIKRISRLLDTAKKAGELQDNADIEQLAEFLYFAWEGAIMHTKASKSANAYQAFLKQTAKFFK